MRKAFRSLWSQLTTSILLMLLVAITLASVVGSWLVNRAFEQYLTRQETIRSETIVHDLGNQYDGAKRAWNQEFLRTIGMYALYDGYILKVYDLGGNMLWDAENHDMSLCGQIMNDILVRMESVKKTGGFAAHVYDIHQGGQKVGSVSITYYGPYFLSENDFQFIRALNSVLIGTGILAALSSILVGCLLARRIARPVTKTIDIVAQIAQGNYDIRFESETNVRELNRLVEAVNHLAGALAEQESLRKRLTTDVAHELRTPLAAVGSHLEAMMDGIWEATPDRLRACYDEVRRLGRLVVDLQRLAKIEGENLSIQKTTVDLLEIARSVTENMAAEAAKKKLQLSVEGEPSLVQADKERMLQAATNLLSNAMKFTPEGGHIRTEVVDTPQEGILRVTDDGIGIPQQEIPLIFERFYRTDKSRNRKTGGAGIGLTIVKSIVAAHGGTVSVESQPSRGSQFSVAIPKD